MSETWLRVVTYHMPDQDDAASASYVKDSTFDALRAMEKQPGFQLGYWGFNPETRTMAAVTYWESREAIDQAQPALAELQASRQAAGMAVANTRNIRLFAVPTGTIWESHPGEAPAQPQPTST